MSQYQQFFAEIINKGLVPLAMLAGGGYVLFLLLQGQQTLIETVCITKADQVITEVIGSHKRLDRMSLAVGKIEERQSNLVPIVTKLLRIEEMGARGGIRRAPAASTP